ncbi:MAG TPA: hypothetical protein VFO93_08470 [Hymenobacter sp.]|uniref:hypothetical protein n=1 Tax=Hymenobacter sp. TaxID=1898978 RepID=UPI002D801CF7|nr:hypothetical protein [Hymenobacter sp.]HET9503562.1 hypothetical protein [Hymenobacter sp.]
MIVSPTTLLTLYLAVGSVASCYAQEEYPNEKCAAGQKLKSISQYNVELSPDGAKVPPRLIDRFFYDQAGRHTQWRQYNVRDSTRYTARTFSYDAQGHLLKTVDLSEDGKDGTIDSARTDTVGYLVYRRLARPSGEVLFEVSFTNEFNQRKQLVKATVLDKQGKPQGYTKYTYNAAGKPVSETSYSGSATPQQQRLHYYYPDGSTLRKTVDIRGSQDTTEIKLFTPNGLLDTEVHFNQQLKRGTIDYKIVRRYDSQQREVAHLTYSTDYLPGNKLALSRREVSQYATGCLKTKTLIYTTTPFTTEEKLGVVFVYRYALYH